MKVEVDLIRFVRGVCQGKYAVLVDGEQHNMICDLEGIVIKKWTSEDVVEEKSETMRWLENNEWVFPALTDEYRKQLEAIATELGLPRVYIGRHSDKRREDANTA